MSADKPAKGSKKGKGKAAKGKPEAAPEIVAEPEAAVAPEAAVEPVEVVERVEGNEPVEAVQAVGAAEPVGVVEPVEPVVAEASPAAVKFEAAEPAVEYVPARTLEGQFAAIPEEPDPPSYAPILTGLGIAVFAWGFLTAPFMILMGMIVFATGMTIWIKELTHEP